MLNKTKNEIDENVWCDVSVWGEWKEKDEGRATATGAEAQEAVGGACLS